MASPDHLGCHRICGLNDECPNRFRLEYLSIGWVDDAHSVVSTWTYTHVYTYTHICVCVWKTTWDLCLSTSDHVSSQDKIISTSTIVLNTLFETVVVCKMKLDDFCYSVQQPTRRLVGCSMTPEMFEINFQEHIGSHSRSMTVTITWLQEQLKDISTTASWPSTSWTDQPTLRAQELTICSPKNRWLALIRVVTKQLQQSLYNLFSFLPILSVLFFWGGKLN